MPQTYVEEFSVLSDFFKSKWGNRSKILTDNDAAQPEPGAPWVRFTVRGGISSLATIGVPKNNHALYPGIILVQVFTPLATGDSVNRELSDQIVAIFENAELNGIDLGLPYISTADEPTEDDWYQINVTVPFTRNSFK